LSFIERILSAFRRQREPSPLQLAQRARREAAEAYAKATQRGDTRDAHWALKAYRRSTTDVLRLERAGGAR
jgi:hypothetical protein